MIALFFLAFVALMVITGVLIGFRQASYGLRPVRRINVRINADRERVTEHA